MAQFVFKKLVADAGLADQFVIDSAAAHTDEIGSDTYYATKEILLLHEVPYEPRAAWQITREDGARWDYIIGMDSANMRDLKRILPPEAHHKLSKLMEWDGQSRDVADPWYTRDFERTYTDVLVGCMALLERLRLRLSRRCQGPGARG
jgi:protein-tyrosine phosphatase